VHLTLIFGVLIFRGSWTRPFLLLFSGFCWRALSFCVGHRNTPCWLAFSNAKHLKSISFNFSVDDLGHFQIGFQILLCHKRIILYWNRDIIILKFVFIFIIIVEIINIYFLSWWMFSLCHPRWDFTLPTLILIIKYVLVQLKSLSECFFFSFLISLSLGRLLGRASLR
jgi:hypothetical protein